MEEVQLVVCVVSDATSRLARKRGGIPGQWVDSLHCSRGQVDTMPSRSPPRNGLASTERGLRLAGGAEV